MTATDPRPDLPRTPIRGLAATLAAGLACAEDMNAGPSPEFRVRREKRHRRTEAFIARSLGRAGNAGPDRRKAMPEPRRMTKHDIS